MANILVTGGSGTIGSFICRKLHALGHNAVVFSRDLGSQLEKCPGRLSAVGDVERRSDIDCAIKRFAIQGIIHTAANKHVNLCEKFPSIAVRSNILGTLNVLEAVRDFDLEKVVVVSTDKACNHEQTYGMSKYLCEQMVGEFVNFHDVIGNSVRFGNVFGSKGSVVPIWKNLIKEGKDIECRGRNGVFPLRFAMLPSEAADLCVDVYFGKYHRGSVIVKPMRVLDVHTLAQVMTKDTDSKIKVGFLRGGESLVEHLLTKDDKMHSLFDDGKWIVDSHYLSMNEEEIKTEAKNAMDYDATKVFLDQVLEQM